MGQRREGLVKGEGGAARLTKQAESGVRRAKVPTSDTIERYNAMTALI